MFSLGESLELTMISELNRLQAKGKLKVDNTGGTKVVMSFEDYCMVGGIAAKYSALKVV